MKISIYAVGVFCDNTPHLTATFSDDPFIPEHWQLVHTQELHLNISKDEVMSRALMAKGMEYEMEARLDYLTGGNHE